MPKREHAYLILQHYKAIERDVSGFAKGNHQLPQITFDSPPDERMRGEVFNCGSNRTRVLLRVRMFDVIQCPGGVGYLRHGLGRGFAAPSARRSAHACTSSAR